MKRTQKGARAAVAAATADDILESAPKSVASGRKEKEEDGNLESKKRKKAITEWIGRPLKPPLHSKDKEDEDEEEDVGAPLDSTEQGSTRDKENEGREDYR